MVTVALATGPDALDTVPLSVPLGDGVSGKFCVVVCPSLMSTVALLLSKPKADTEIEYEPTGRVHWNVPSAPVVAVRLTGPVTFTWAPESGAPVEAFDTVPLSVPTGPRGDCATAANALSLPSPQTLLSSAVPPHEVSGVSTAVSSSSVAVWSMLPISDGAADHISATVPAVWGDAIDVPLEVAYPLPGTEDRTFTPGAAMFGLRLPFSPGPRLENEAITPLMSNAPEE